MNAKEPTYWVTLWSHPDRFHTLMLEGGEDNTRSEAVAQLGPDADPSQLSSREEFWTNAQITAAAAAKDEEAYWE